jgi:hypothetical protein
MTDREIYARVYAACINGIFSTTRNVTLEWDGERVGMSVFCHKFAMNAIESAPKYEPTKLVEAQAEMIKVLLENLDTRPIATPILEHIRILGDRIDRERTAL